MPSKNLLNFVEGSAIDKELVGAGVCLTRPLEGANVEIVLEGQRDVGSALDLYYSDPSTIGNAHLKPESAWNFEGGADWFASSNLMVASTVFYSRQHDAIDYVRAAATDPWQATNLSGLHFTGWENSANWQPSQANQFKASWTLLIGAQQALHGLQSEYVFNYPVNNTSMEGTHVFRDGIMLHTRIGVAQRYQQTAYAVWDVAAAKERGIWRPYVRFANITNTGYQEVVDVKMLGRTVIAGMEIILSKPSR